MVVANVVVFLIFQGKFLVSKISSVGTRLFWNFCGPSKFIIKSFHFFISYYNYINFEVLLALWWSGFEQFRVIFNFRILATLFWKFQYFGDIVWCVRRCAKIEKTWFQNIYKAAYLTLLLFNDKFVALIILLVSLHLQ